MSKTVNMSKTANMSKNLNILYKEYLIFCIGGSIIYGVANASIKTINLYPFKKNKFNEIIYYFKNIVFNFTVGSIYGLYLSSKSLPVFMAYLTIKYY
jgi:hypothetical protein